MDNDLQAKDRQYLWHPYTQMHDYASRDLLCIERAEGLFLYDRAGRPYYDTISSWWCIVHGHNHPTIMAAIRSQLARLDQVLLAGVTHEPAILLAEKLVQLTPPPLTKVFIRTTVPPPARSRSRCQSSTGGRVATRNGPRWWPLPAATMATPSAP